MHVAQERVHARKELALTRAQVTDEKTCCAAFHACGSARPFAHAVATGKQEASSFTAPASLMSVNLCIADLPDLEADESDAAKPIDA